MVAAQGASNTSEAADFNDWSGDHIRAESDPGRLKRAAAHFAATGCFATAEACAARLTQLGAGDVTQQKPGAAEEEEGRALLLSLQAETRALAAYGEALSSDLLAPVRRVRDDAGVPRPVPVPVPEPVPAAKAGWRATKRERLDVPDARDQAATALQDGLRLPPSGTAPKQPAAAAAAQAPARLIQECQPRGCKATQAFIAANAQLPARDRLAAAQAARSKGNDAYKARDFGEAVEQYTICIALAPQPQVAAHTNRAAAYLALRDWPSAVCDCTKALQLLAEGRAAPAGSGAAKAPQPAQSQAAAVKQASKRGKGQPEPQHQMQQLQQVLEVAQAMARKRQAADAARQQGDAALREGELQAALTHYSAALQAAPGDARALANRAAAWGGLQWWDRAEQDCEAALAALKASPDPALQRKVEAHRTLALEGQGRLQEAVAAAKALAAAHPGDVELQERLQLLSAAYRRQLQALVQAQQPQVQAQEAQLRAAGGGSAAAALPRGHVPVQRHAIIIAERSGSESDDEADSDDE